LDSAQEKTDYTWMMIPGLLASSTATVAFVMLSSCSFGNHGRGNGVRHESTTFSALFAMLIFQKEEAPVIAIATVFSIMSIMSFSILQKAQKNADDNGRIAHQSKD
jgi:hypothetical protein